MVVRQKTCDIHTDIRTDRPRWVPTRVAGMQLKRGGQTYGHTDRPRWGTA